MSRAQWRCLSLRRSWSVNTFGRNLALWVIIALLVVALFNLFQGTGQRGIFLGCRRRTEVDVIEDSGGVRLIQYAQ